MQQDQHCHHAPSTAVQALQNLFAEIFAQEVQSGKRVPVTSAAHRRQFARAAAARTAVEQAVPEAGRSQPTFFTFLLQKGGYILGGKTRGRGGGIGALCLATAMSGPDTMQGILSQFASRVEMLKKAMVLRDARCAPYQTPSLAPHTLSQLTNNSFLGFRAVFNHVQPVTHVCVCVCGTMIDGCQCPTT
jgi:hypothetical protein